VTCTEMLRQKILPVKIFTFTHVVTLKSQKVAYIYKIIT
jgi:hypothetical protein